MKVLVCVKRVLDPYVKVRIKNDNSGVDLTGCKLSMNPFDEIAVEAAIQWKENGQATETVVLSVGEDGCQETLRSALAMGIDRAVQVKTSGDYLSPLTLAKLLKVMVERESPDLVVLGKQSIDGDHNQTGQMLAALLDWPQGTFASQCDFSNAQIDVTREVDGGLETLKLQLPAVITTDLRLNEPRFASLPNIMKAKQKPMDVVDAQELGISLEPLVTVKHHTAPPKRQAGKKVQSVDELVDCLKQTEQVI